MPLADFLDFIVKKGNKNIAFYGIFTPIFFFLFLEKFS